MAADGLATQGARASGTMILIQLNRDYKNPLHFDVVDRYLRRIGDKAIPGGEPTKVECNYIYPNVITLG